MWQSAKSTGSKVRRSPRTDTEFSDGLNRVSSPLWASVSPPSSSPFWFPSSSGSAGLTASRPTSPLGGGGVQRWPRPLPGRRGEAGRPAPESRSRVPRRLVQSPGSSPPAPAVQPCPATSTSCPPGCWTTCAATWTRSASGTGCISVSGPPSDLAGPAWKPPPRLRSGS